MAKDNLRHKSIPSPNHTAHMFLKWLYSLIIPKITINFLAFNSDIMQVVQPQKSTISVTVYIYYSVDLHQSVEIVSCSVNFCIVGIKS